MLSRTHLSPGKREAAGAADPELERLAGELERDPVASCPDLPRHRRAVGRSSSGRSGRRPTSNAQVKGRSASLARQFDRVLQVLESWGYLDGWALTPAGERLARIYHEADLLIAECLDGGLFDGLDPASLAGLVSTFTHERRGPGEGPVPWFPSGEVRERWARIEGLHGRLADAEERAGLPVTRDLDPGFVALAHAWAAGEDLDEVLEDEELSGGDFVRNVKQLIDLLRQLGDAAPVAGDGPAPPGSPPTTSSGGSSRPPPPCGWPTTATSTSGWTTSSGTRRTILRADPQG